MFACGPYRATWIVCPCNQATDFPQQCPYHFPSATCCNCKCHGTTSFTFTVPASDTTTQTIPSEGR